MKLDISATWHETTALVSANKEVLVILAGLFFFLPGLSLELFLPKPTLAEGQDFKQMMEALNAYWISAAPYFLLTTLIQLCGQLAIIRLIGAITPCTVGEALRQGLAGLPYLIVANLAVAIGLILLGGILVGLPLLLGSKPVVLLGGMIVLGVMLWVMLRLTMAGPLVAIENLRNPLLILRRSWDMTEGNAGAILRFFLLFSVALLVVMLAAQAIGGILIGLLLGNQAGEIARGVISAGLTAGSVPFVSGTFVVFYRHLSRPSRQ